MSYDVEISQKCPHCGHVDAFDWSPTYNLREMFVAAFGGEGLRGFDGKTGGELVPMLERALLDMEKRPNWYRQFDSPNGWGSFDGDGPGSSIPDCVRAFLAACRRMPDATVKV